MPSSLILCLLSVGLIAACGDEDNDSDAGSAEDFIAKADEICTASAIEAIKSPLPTPTTAEEAVPVLEETLQRREEQLIALQDLGQPPAEIANEWNAALQRTEQRVTATEELVKLAKQGVAATDPKYANTVAESSSLDQEENELLAGIGSTACAEVLSPEAREEIIAMVTEFETEALDDCTDFMTDEAVELLFGSLEECQRIQENPPPEGFTKKVEVTHIEGIDEVSATVDASLSGGIGDGQRVTYTVVFVDDTYKIDAVTTQA